MGCTSCIGIMGSERTQSTDTFRIGDTDLVFQHSAAVDFFNKVQQLPYVVPINDLTETLCQRCTISFLYL